MDTAVNKINSLISQTYILVLGFRPKINKLIIQLIISGHEKCHDENKTGHWAESDRERGDLTRKVSLREYPYCLSLTPLSTSVLV